MALARTLQQIRRVGAAALPRAGLSQRSVGFPSGDVTLAISIQASAVRFALLRETPDAGDGKNVYSQERFPKRSSPRPSRGHHSAKCEMADDLPFLLPFRAIAKAREVLLLSAHGESQTLEYAKGRPGYGRVPQLPARLHADMTAATNPGAHKDPIPLPIFRQGEVNNAHH